MAHKHSKKRFKTGVRAKLKNTKNKAMAYGRSFRSKFRRFNPFRRRSKSYSRPQRNFGRSYGRSRSGGGFSRRMPVIGWKVPGLFIWLAIIGGGIFFFKDALKPMIDKFKSKL